MCLYLCFYTYVFVFAPGSRPSIASLRSRICICASVCVCICAFICVFICAFICICIRVCICAGISIFHCFLEVLLGGHGCSGDDHFGSCNDGNDGRIKRPQVMSMVKFSPIALSFGCDFVLLVQGHPVCIIYLQLCNNEIYLIARAVTRRTSMFYKIFCILRNA